MAASHSKKNLFIKLVPPIMRTRLSTFFLTLIAIAFNFNNYAQAQNSSSDRKAISMLNFFYTSYITEVSNGNPRTFKRNIDSIQKKYCTTTLLAKIKKKELDTDPFLKAQDSNIEFLKTLVIKKDFKKPNTYIVSYGDNNDKTTIHLVVKEQKEVFKIFDLW
ncbi:MAG TPA: hypothetical protein VHC47_10770 [Mucilaginibacter sp.]|nr:hypothetical protein [Mucilaginibacter sp.]